MNTCKYKSAEELPMILNVKQVSEFIGIGLSQAYEMIRRVDFPAFRIGKRLFIPRDKFLEWIDYQTQNKESVFYNDLEGCV